MLNVKSYLEKQFEGQKGVQYGSDINWQRSLNHVKYLAKVIVKNSKVLDIGCGHGHHMYLLKQLRPDLDITGIDIKKQKLWNVLKKEGYNLKIMDATNLKFPDKTFDVIISFGVMEHVEDDNLFLKEINRVLKYKGKLFIFNLPNEYSITEFIAGFIGIINHEVRYDKYAIIKKLSNNYLTAIRIRREFLIPAQYNHISVTLNKVLNKYTKSIIIFDKILCSTPLNFFAQSFFVRGVKNYDN